MSFAPNEIYHICQRGVDGRLIFPNPSYYKRFLLGMLAFNSKEQKELRFINPSDIRRPRKEDYLVNVLSYILMRNHVHILLKCGEPLDAANYVRKVFGGYTKYFNARNKRKGVLFQGRAKVKHIESDRYLQHVINYIHLNALDYSYPEWREGGIKNIKDARLKLFEYPWSSLAGILKKKDDYILAQNAIEEFIAPHRLIDSMFQWSSDEYLEHPDVCFEP